MDRRQKKTRAAIFNAFNELLTKKSYYKITVQEIIDAADIGRATFYSHFETKDDLLKEMANSILDHVFSGMPSPTIKCDHDFSTTTNSETIITHLLYHLSDNRKNILGILTCDNGEMFFQFFKHYLVEMLPKYMEIKPQKNIPENFIINHISGSFVNMVQWWIKNGLKESPEVLTSYFEAVIYPILQVPKSQ